MATEEKALATKPKLKTPYQLDLAQTTQACKVLLRHITDEKKRRETTTSKPNLLASNDDVSDEGQTSDGQDTPIWLILSTKKHIVDQKRLKPGKIALPHPLNTSPSSTICLITADPSSTFSALLTTPTFPSHLRSRITRVLSISKIKTAYSQYEAQRQLVASHDHFLADDRIITYLPTLLGKTFYKSTTKRPIPVSIAGPAPRGDDGKRRKLDPAASQSVKKAAKEAEGGRGAASAEVVAREIERALGCALVNLAPGVSTAVKAAHAGMDAEMVAANVAAVVEGLTTRFVTKQWRNVRAVHIKGPNSMAFPVWLADELWVDDEDVYEEKRTFGKKKALAGGEASKAALEVTQAEAEVPVADGVSRKRKAPGAEKEREKMAAAPTKHAKKKRKADAEAQEKLGAEAVARKMRIQKQKAAAMAEAAAQAV